MDDGLLLIIFSILLSISALISSIRRRLTIFSLMTVLCVFCAYTVILMLSHAHGKFAFVCVGLVIVISFDWLNRNYLYAIMRLLSVHASR